MQEWVGYGFVFACTALCGVSLFALFLLKKKKAADAKLLIHKADLDRTSRILIQKNIELFEQSIRQQKMLETKDDFIAIVSHQLRTPITEIKWSASAMLGDTAEALSPAQRTSLQILFSSADRMVKIVDTIIQLVASEQKTAKILREPYDVDRVVAGVVARTQKDFHDKTITLQQELGYGEDISSIDQSSFEMLVSNLVENAFHYTPEGGAVTVRSRSGPEDAYVLSVIDTGMGMSEEKKKTLFKKFNRGKDAIKINAGGSGLGLYIVKNITEQNGGEITFTSSEGVGTTFTLTFPQNRKV